MRGKQLIQILHVLALLSGQNGTTMPELMEKLDITRRSVERLLIAMQNAGFPLYNDREEGEKTKRWYIEESYVAKLPNTVVPNLKLTLFEIICIYLSKKDDPVYKGTRIERWINSVYAKLSLLCPDEIKTDLNRIRKLHVTKKSAFKLYQTHEKTIEQLAESIISQDSIQIEYNAFSKDSMTKIEINPLHLFEDMGGLYLIGQRIKDGQIRTYAIERITKIKRTGNEFNYPQKFCPDTYLGQTFGIIDDGPISVKIQFSPSQARYITEREWVPGQNIEELDDGSVVLSFSTRGKRDVKKWVLGWGNDATVLEPDALREEIRGELEKMLKKYD